MRQWFFGAAPANPPTRQRYAHWASRRLAEVMSLLQMLVGCLQVETFEEEFAHPYVHAGGASHKGLWDRTGVASNSDCHARHAHHHTDGSGNEERAHHPTPGGEQPDQGTDKDRDLPEMTEGEPEGDG